MVDWILHCVYVYCKHGNTFMAFLQVHIYWFVVHYVVVRIVYCKRQLSLSLLRFKAHGAQISDATMASMIAQEVPDFLYE